MTATMDSRNDKRLVTAAARGDERAFEALVERHFNAVYLTAYARLEEREAAEDLAQEVFLRAYLHLGQLSDPARFPNWVCRVARNLAEDWRRRRQTASQLLPLAPLGKGVEELAGPSEDNAREKLERKESEGAVRKALLTLSPELREIILLHYAEGLNDREIARRLGVHHSTVRYHRERALDQFRDRIGSWLGEEAPALLPGRKAASRAAAVVAAAAALSVESKAALASASAQTLPSCSATVVTLAAPAQPASAAAAAPALLATLKASAFAGAIVMAKGKLLIAGGAALVLAVGGGGAYYSAAGPRGFLTRSISITKDQPGAQRSKHGNELLGKVRLTGQTAKEIIAGVFELHPTRVILETPLPEGTWEVNITGARKGADLRTFAQPEIERVFGIKLRRDKRPEDAMVMVRATGVPSRFTPSTDDDTRIEMRDGRVTVENGTLDPLRMQLNQTLNKPVFDETGLTGNFDYDVRWHPGKLDQINVFLRKEAGLELVEGIRDVPVMVVAKGAAR